MSTPRQHVALSAPSQVNADLVWLKAELQGTSLACSGPADHAANRLYLEANRHVDMDDVTFERCLTLSNKI
jgi:hypothetical protein